VTITRRHHRLLLAALVFLAYFPLLGAGFVYDDLIIVEGNPTIDSLSPASIARIFGQNYWYPHLEVDNLYRPVTVLSHAVEHALVGEAPWLYHLTNILLHLASVLLLHGLLRRLLPGAGWLAAALAGIFAVHPAISEAVCNVTCRADLLVVLLILLAAGAMTAESQRARRPWLLPLLALAALFSKENGVVLLPVVLLIDTAAGAGEDDGKGLGKDEGVGKGEGGPVARLRATLRRQRLAYGLGLAAVVVGLLIRARALGHAAPTTVITPPELNILAYEPAGVRMLTAVKILGLAAAKFVWPFPLSFDYGTATITPVRTPLHPVFLASLLGWAGALWLAWRQVPRSPLPLAGLLIMLGTLLPVSNLFFPITSIFNERFLYLPAVGLVLLLAGLLPRPPGRAWRPVLAALAVVVLLAGLATWRRTADWRSVETITVATAAASPRSANAVMDLAGLRGRQGEVAAQGELLQQAVAAFPESPRANYALGQWYQRQGDLAAAAAHYETALTDRPTRTSLKAAMKLGFLNATAGDEEAAARYYERALAINPREAGAHYNLALVLRKLGDPRAEEHARMAARLGKPLPPADAPAAAPAVE
jgi:tetratricopeptide (TPR) repeat protein